MVSIKVAFKLRLNGGRCEPCGYLGKRKTASAKALGQGCAWQFEEEHGDLCGWRKVNERKSKLMEVSLVVPDEPHQPSIAPS